MDANEPAGLPSSFAASQRDAETDEIEAPGRTSGRFTQAILEAASNFTNLVSYPERFTAANAIINGASAHGPVLYDKGPDATMIVQRPRFRAAHGGAHLILLRDRRQADAMCERRRA